MSPLTKKILVLPTWLLMKTVFLPAGHPWKGKRITLGEWARSSTQENIAFSIFFWVGGLDLSWAFWYIRHK